MWMQIVGLDWGTEHALTQTYLKAIVLHEVHNFTMLKRRKERENPRPLAENKLSVNVKTTRNAILKMPIKLIAKNLFLIKLIFKE